MSMVQGLATDKPILASAPAATPSWLDRSLYPFQSRFLSLDGHRLHYIDEGSGPLLLFLHANPLWSFQYRNLIRPLSARFRCVALDYPGFGLSDVRPDFQHSLIADSTLVERFIRALELKDVTLVLHDTSISIGLGVVTRHPDWFSGAVISNGFAWPLSDDPSIYRFLQFVASPLFRFMIIQFNFLIRYGNATLRSKFLVAERRAYLMPFADKRRRHHQHDLFRSILKSYDYLLDLKGRLADIQTLPVLLAYAPGDPSYKAGFVERYENIFPNHHTVLIQGAHHFPQDEDPEAMVAAIQEWWDNFRHRT